MNLGLELVYDFGYKAGCSCKEEEMCHDRGLEF
jgi:ribosome modulation factor